MSLLFVVGALSAIAGALGVVLARNPVHGVIAMVGNFIGLALLYLSLQAEFLAVIQLIVYAGAIMVLFLFVIALLTAGRDPAERGPDRLPFQAGAGVLLGAALVAILGGSVLLASGREAAEVGDGFGKVASFGTQLLQAHLLAFELTALVLMVAVIGVILLVGRRQQAGD